MIARSRRASGLCDASPAPLARFNLGAISRSMPPVCEPSPINAAEVAKRLAELLDARKQEYALGGAIALGYWGVLRGTVDVDVTSFPGACGYPPAIAFTNTIAGGFQKH